MKPNSSVSFSYINNTTLKSGYISIIMKCKYMNPAAICQNFSIRKTL